MFRSSSLVSLTAAVCMLVGAGAFAQRPATKPAETKPPPRSQKDDTPQKIGVLDVRLPISVKQNKKFVSGLTANNFEVYEDGKRQKIEKFISPSQLPLNIAILMDTSNSVKLKLPFEKDAAEDFVATVTTFRRKD